MGRLCLSASRSSELPSCESPAQISGSRVAGHCDQQVGASAAAIDTRHTILSMATTAEAMGVRLQGCLRRVTFENVLCGQACEPGDDVLSNLQRIQCSMRLLVACAELQAPSKSMRQLVLGFCTDGLCLPCRGSCSASGRLRRSRHRYAWPGPSFRHPARSSWMAWGST